MCKYYSSHRQNIRVGVGIKRTSGLTILLSSATAMTEPAPPPIYQASQSPQQVADPQGVQKVEEDPPPNYNVPTQFAIGNSLTDAPLVSIQEIKTHLSLLHAFAELKNSVDAVQGPILGIQLNKEQRWAWFVGCAVERCA